MMLAPFVMRDAGELRRQSMLADAKAAERLRLLPVSTAPHGVAIRSWFSALRLFQVPRVRCNRRLALPRLFATPEHVIVFATTDAAGPDAGSGDAAAPLPRWPTPPARKPIRGLPQQAGNIPGQASNGSAVTPGRSRDPREAIGNQTGR